MNEPNDFTQSNPFYNPAKDENEVKWRMFLGWQRAWEYTRVVSMMGCGDSYPILTFINGTHGLVLITQMELNFDTQDELYTRFDFVAEYWETWR